MIPQTCSLFSAASLSGMCFPKLSKTDCRPSQFIATVFVSLARSRMGLSSVPCIQFGPLFNLLVRTFSFKASYQECIRPTDRPSDLAHCFDITVDRSTHKLSQKISKTTHPSTNSISSLEYSHFDTLLQQDIRTSQPSNTSADNANMWNLSRRCPNHVWFIHVAL